VIVDGHSIHELSDAKRTRHRAETMGFIFQAFNLIPVFTATENVELPLLLARVPEREARERARDTLTRVGLGHRLDRRPPELSGGEQQRVAIARALAGRPRLIWADEPTGNLDSEMASAVMDLLSELHEEGLTLVLVTHDPTVAARADRLITVKDGEVVADERLRTLRGGGIEGGGAGMTAPLVLVALVSLPFILILVRRPVLRRLALRNAVRRPREAALVVLGSLLGAAIITGSAVVGDTMDASIRQVARTHLGPIDELVTVRGPAEQTQLLRVLRPLESGNIDGILAFSTIEAAVTSTGPRVRTAPRSQLVSVDFAQARSFGGDAEATGITGANPEIGRAAITQTSLERSASRWADELPSTRTGLGRVSSSIVSCRVAGSLGSGSGRAGGAQRARLPRNVRRHSSGQRRRHTADLAHRSLQPRRGRERSATHGRGQRESPCRGGRGRAQSSDLPGQEVDARCGRGRGEGVLFDVHRHGELRCARRPAAAREPLRHARRRAQD
jgi:predicted ABC-type transport system involved in lysophospholipase L1 biosynthesis ATPase subunit